MPLGRCVKPVVRFGRPDAWCAHHFLGCGGRGLTLADSINLSSLARRRIGRGDVGLGLACTPTTARLWLMRIFTGLLSRKERSALSCH